MSTNKASSRMTAVVASAVALLAWPVAADAGVNSIQSIESRDQHGSTRILIRGTSTPTFTVYKLDNPARVVVDIASSRLTARRARSGDGKVVWRVNSWAVGDVTAHRLGGSGASVTRVVVAMARPASYSVKATGRNVSVVITPRDAAPVRPSGVNPREVASAHASARVAKATARAAKASARAAKASARAAKADAARARKNAQAVRQKAQREISAAKAEAARTRAELDAAKRRAQQEISVARADAQRTIADAKKRAASADLAMSAANKKMKLARRRLGEASALRTRALAAEKRAKLATSESTAAELRAARAEKRAATRRTEALRAAQAAAKFRRLAESAAGDTKRAAELRKRAEQEARVAEARSARSERAAQLAEKRRSAAEFAARVADQRKSNAERALAEADAERQQAEASRARAESQRQRAIAERRAADKRRSLAQASAKNATRRAALAQQLRATEEAAYKRAAQARARAESRRAAAERASTELRRTIAAASVARRAAAKRRGEVAAAERKVAVQRKRGAQRSAAKTEGEVLRLQKLLIRAENRLASRNDAVTAKRAETQVLDRKRRRAAATLDKQRKSAVVARDARRGEEAKLADLVATRADEERGLIAVRKARQAAETKAAAAEKRAAAADLKAAAARARAVAAEKRAARATKTIALARADAKRVRVRQVRFEDLPKAAQVTISLSAPTKPRIIQSTGSRRILEVSNAAIARKLERTLDTRKYRGPVRAVSSYRSRKDPSKVRIVVELASSARSKLIRVGNDYQWQFAKVAPTKVARAASSRKRSARSSRIPAPVLGSYGSSSTPITQQSVAQTPSSRRKVYRGTKIDLDFKDADIHNLLRLLADVGGVNIVIPDEIKYSVTVRMRRVPWDQALEVILASKGLWYQRNGNLYRIAPRKELDAEAQAEAERRAALIQAETPQPEYITLNYSSAGDIEDQARLMLSPKGQLQVDERTNTVVIIDVRANRRNIANLLARLDTPTPQIQIEARIVEARSTFLRQIGVQWGGSASSSAAGGNATGLIFPNSVRVAGGGQDSQTPSGGVAAPSDFAVNLPAAVGSGAGGALGFALGSVGGNFNLSLRLSALEDQGTVRIVSAPKATVVNNVRAKIVSGVSIPVSVISSNGVQTQFVPADLSLEVTPTVSQRDCAVTLDIKVSKNEADFVNTGARGDPTILRKEIETRVLIADGATTVVGGIYTRNSGLSYSKVPFFGDLPVFGWFFKSRRENDERTEFLVFLTPKITNKAALRCE